MKDFSFPRSCHLRRPSDFREAYRRGRKSHGRGFVIYRHANSLEHPRLGLSVSRKRGGAVVRNRLRRRLREAVRLNWRRWELGGEDLIIVAKRGSASLSYDQIVGDVELALTRPRGGRRR